MKTSIESVFLFIGKVIKITSLIFLGYRKEILQGRQINLTMFADRFSLLLLVILIGKDQVEYHLSKEMKLFDSNLRNPHVKSFG